MQRYSQECADQVIACLVRGGGRRQAAALIGVDTGTIRNWRREHADFDQRCREASRLAGEAIERRLYDKALEGDPVSGNIWLKANMPEKYNPAVVLKAAEVKSALTASRAAFTVDLGEDGVIIFERDIDPTLPAASKLIPVIEVLDNGRMAAILAPPLPRGLTGATMQLPQRVTVLVAAGDRSRPLAVMADNLHVPLDQAPALLFRVEAWNCHASQPPLIEGTTG